MKYLYGRFRLHVGQTAQSKSVVQRSTTTPVSQTSVVTLDTVVQTVVDIRKP